MMRASRWAAVLLCLTMCGACGVDTETNAHVFASDEVPAGILDRTLLPTTSLGATSTTIAPLSTYRLFFVRAGALAEVRRTSVGMPTPTDMVEALAQGPSNAEVSANYRSALGTTTAVASVRTNGALATVDLARSFADIPRGDQVLAIGQITLTLTDRPDVVRVAFTMANVTIDVPKGNGSLTHDVVGADDFRELLRLPTTTTVPVGASGPSGPSGATGAAPETTVAG